MEAATRNVAANGYSGARTRGIAESAGMSEAAIYRHFGSLEDLGQEVYRVAFSKYAERIQEATDAGEAPSEKIRNAIRATLTLYREDRPAFIATLIRLPNFTPALPEGLIYPINRIESIIRDGQDAGVIRPGEPLLLAAMFFGALLRPMLLAEGSAAGPFAMLDDTQYDQTIEDVALATLFPAQD
nr:TetR/AcrR family transcriptional regulator [Galbitalea soli]